MRHLAVFRAGENKPPIVVLQYPGIDTGNYVLAAPLYPAGAAKPIDIVTPMVTLDGEAYLLGTHLLASVRASALGDEIGSLLAHAPSPGFSSATSDSSLHPLARIRRLPQKASPVNKIGGTPHEQ